MIYFGQIDEFDPQEGDFDTGPRQNRGGEKRVARNRKWVLFNLFIFPNVVKNTVIHNQ